MRKLAIVSVALLTMLTFSGTLFAAEDLKYPSTDNTGNRRFPDNPPAVDETTQNNQNYGNQMNSSDHMMMQNPRASKMLGCEVKGQDGQKLGTVNDIIIGNDGQVDYLVISRGGTLGVGKDLTAIPWDAANARFGGDAVHVGFTKDKLDNAPTFANWNEFQSDRYGQQVRSYYGEPSNSNTKTKKY